MHLTKNEKLALKLLIKNGRISDTDIARKLKITTQAVGKIRRKLETNGYIKGYSAVVDYGKLGVNTFALAMIKFTLKGWEDLGELGIEKNLIGNPYIINAFRIPEGDPTHIVLYGFKDIDELDSYFRSLRTKQPTNKYMQTQKVYVFSQHSLIKDTPMDLFHKVIDEMTNGKKIKPKQLHFDEIERFKEKLER